MPGLRLLHGLRVLFGLRLLQGKGKRIVLLRPTSRRRLPSFLPLSFSIHHP